MRRLLQQIYGDLSNGRLSKEEALEKIRALKLKDQGTGTGALLATPIWQAGSVDASAGVSRVEYTEHHIVLAELPQVDVQALASLLPQSRCLPLEVSLQKNIAERYSDSAVACFERIQTILQSRAQGKVLVQIVVPGEKEQVLFVGLSGLLKTAALENPRLAGQVVLVPPQIEASDLAGLLQAEQPWTLETPVRYEGGLRQVLRWQEVPASAEASQTAFKENGVYLITGGLGRLGVLFAREIIEHTTEARVVLTGRGPLSGERQAAFDGLSAQSQRVSYRQVDLVDLADVEQLIAGVRNEHGRLSGIIHAAGTTADSFILKKTSAELRTVLAPKVTGTFNLDQASRDVELDYFVLFSSAASALGNLGQADYAAANGFMDQFAALRNREVAARRRHGRSLSINWPLWQAGGMILDQAAVEFVRRTTGGSPMQTATGINAFHRSLALPYDQVLVAEGDLTEMRRALVAGGAMTSELQATTPPLSAAIGSYDLAEKTESYLRRQLSELLKLPSHKIDPQAALETYGIDSILALKLTNHLEKTFGSLSKTLFFEHQTIDELTEYFLQAHPARLATLFGDHDNRETKPVESRAETSPPVQTKPISSRFGRVGIAAPSPVTEPDPIAIIGLSGRYPEAVDVEAYWHNLRDGRDCIIEVPQDRWDWREYFSDDRTKSGHHFSKWGGFIAGVAEFDPLFFNISPKEAKSIDPQERLFLQHAWMAIEDAGYTRASLQMPSSQDLPGQVGVYVGVMYSEYQLYGAEASVRGKRLGILGSMASISNRVSYALNLHGPSMTLDTMCSSSLTAIHLACQDLKLRRTSLAIAGGVNVTIHPNKYLALSAGQFISTDGHCQSFGEGGDGYIPGEGVGVVVLKRLSEARRDGDHIYGVIRGSALNHGGKTNGYSVPNPQAQSTAISRALAESGTDARHVSYIEAHGTGTKLGDPIEIAALSKAFNQYTQDTGFCLIGSAKSNIGHCESAAGIAGLTKVLLQMQHQQIVPSLHSAQLNPHIDFDGSPFVVNQTLRQWEPAIDGRRLPRIAGISSFGAGGSNAHVIVEEYQRPVQQPTAYSQLAIVLSARTAEQLQMKARDLLDFVRGRLDTIDLASLAYTLQTGREAMDERIGFVVSSAGQLVEKLQAYAAGEREIEDVYQGQAKRDREALSLFRTDRDLQQTIEKWITGWKLDKLLELWVKGLEVDWSELYGEVKPRRISLPTYPFSRERYWIDTETGGATAANSVAHADLHPLLHSNTSDLSEQRYTSTFTGDELFLVKKALPAMAYLEMARAAIEQASPARPESTVLELRDTEWAQPGVVSEAKRISVALSANGRDDIDYEIYSEYDGQEIVHCQGRATLCRLEAPAAIDLEQLERQMGQGTIEPGNASDVIQSIHRGAKQLLARLRLPSAMEDTSSDYVLHPTLMEGALQACAGAIEARPLALESLRIVAACSKEMIAWARDAVDGHATGGIVKLDIDLCDARGNVCAQMRGLTWQPAARRTGQQAVLPTASPAIPVPGREISIAAPERKEIVLAPDQHIAPALVERKKPAAISLAAPSAPVSPRATPASRVPITLSNAAAESVAPSVSPVRVYGEGNGMFSIQVATAPAKDVIADMVRALDRLQHEASAKVLRISGLERCFTHPRRDDYNESVARGLYHAIASVPYPVIAVLQGNAIGAGFMFAALCDFMVCNEDAQYRYTDTESQYFPTTDEAVLFSERFGDTRAHDFLYVSTSSTGAHLRAKGWTCPILPLEQVEAYAQELAATLATKPNDALRLLKQHLTGRVAALVTTLTPVDVAAPASETPPAPIMSPAEHIHLDTAVENVLVIRFDIADTGDLRRIFAEIRQTEHYKAIVLASEESDFLKAVDEDVLLESDIPVVAALAGNASGDAWLNAQFCDACVYDQTAVYSSANAGQTAPALFAHRFGNEAAREILLTGAEYSGADLQHRVGALVAVEHDQVLPVALQVAASWARLPRTTLTSWKKHNVKTIRERVRSLPVGWEPRDATAEPLIDGPAPIALQSHVVTASAHPGGVLVVKMEDREAKNMFSEALMDGLSEVFAHVEQVQAYKVVILTGYDSYFASGGTKESLLAIQAGRAKFTDTKIFQSPLDCRLPVIAAMQGHGIGAGWCLGMFADIVLLSEESQYVSPYMSYGFTPGAGATWILADRIGHDLSRESLMAARYYSGRQLKDRGLKLPIERRADMEAAAMALARRVATNSRDHLIGLKRQLTAYARQPLEETYRLEVAMHEKTFVGQPDTLARIQANFHQEVEPPASSPQTVPVQAAPQPVSADDLPTITATLRTLLAGELQMRESDVDENAQFVDLGLDSISGVMWLRKVNERYGISIDATKVYSYPTLAQLSRHVREEAEKRGTLRPAGPRVAVEASPSWDALAPMPAVKTLTSRRSRTAARRHAGAAAPRISQPIAVVGMAGQFPQARNLEEFWRNLAEGRNCITEVPRQRWDVNAYYQPGGAVPGKTNSRWVGALEEYDLFDPLFFNISPTEAENMDPQQRLFLQACWHSIEDAGYDARVLSGSRCGVFVGCAAGDYHQTSRTQQLSAHSFTGGATSILAARICYFLNLQGPCVSIDTACSSSLVAIAQACDSLSSGTSDLALAGGVYVMSGPAMHIMTSQAGMLSPEGRCFSFDQRADGFVPGEGVGVVVLKRLADAQKDQDIICGVIHGWGVNQDGRTNGITAPNPESQTRLEQEVYDKYEIDPANIQLIEAHGTGTKLGDPIEVEGLKASFAKYTQKKQYCALGAVKSNIGHCLTAAGIAGVIKLLLALKHKQLPPTINFERLNEHIDLAESPFYVNTRLQEWELHGAATRLSAISSFGFSGTNAHIVIGEHLPPAGVERPISVVPRNASVIVPLSARTTAQLQQRVLDLLEFIRTKPLVVDLGEIAYTLQAGRAAMEERLGFLVSSIEQLTEKLDAYSRGVREIEGVHRGQVKRDRETLSLFSTDEDLQQTIDRWMANGKLGKLSDLWVKGLELNWSKLYGDVKPRRVSLPTYPFSKERYWIETAAGEENDAAGGALAGRTTILHPLLHVNTSDLSEQRYCTTFCGDEFFLADHEADQKTLSAVAYLEMARVAIDDASPARGESTVLELRDTLWEQPLVVREKTQVSIALVSNGDDGIDYEVYSRDGDREIVHCRGRAVFSDPAVPGTLDLEQIKAQMSRGELEPAGASPAIAAIHRGDGQLLARLRLPSSVAAMPGEYVLHPSSMEGALQAAASLSDSHAVPTALQTLRVFSPCRTDMLAWVRYASSDSTGDLDLDLCEEQGNVCVQMRGLSFRHTSESAATHPREASRPMFFQEYWLEQPRPSAAQQPGETKFIIFADPESRAALSNSDPEGHFAGACVVDQGDSYRRVSDCHFQCRFNDSDDIYRLLDEESSATDGRASTIIYTWAKGKQIGGVHALFGLFKTIKASARRIDQVILVGQYDPSRAETCWDYSWVGFERSLRQVLPETQISVLYTSTGACTSQQLQEAAQSDGVLWYRDGQCLTLSIRAVDLHATAEEAVLKQGGTYLITGGCGALGQIFARYLAEHYGARLLLLGRRQLSPRIQEQLELLVRAGALDAQYYAVDVADQAALTAWSQTLSGPISGIIHAAGVESSGPFFQRTASDIDSVLRPKTLGTMALDEVFGAQPLDFICHFSSTAAALGDHGAADYAIANRFQTAYGIHRRQMTEGRGKTIVVNWPFWLEGGMGFKDPELAARYLKMASQELGNEPLLTQTGLEIWRDILQADLPQTMVMVAESARVEKFLHRMYHERRRPAPVSDAQGRPERQVSYRYANKVEEVYSLILPAVGSKMEYLTFCPFETKRQGFSMSATYLNPKKHAADRHLVHVKQTEMRQVLFCHEEFSKLESALDFGCGHGTDVIQMGTLFPHLRVDGFTIAADQARLGNQRIAARDLGSRVKIHHKDSAKDAFPGRYDLIFGIEVCPHVEDKDGLFRNIRNSLKDDGTVLLMDVICNQEASVVDQMIGMNVPTREEWLNVMARFHFRVDELIDVSPQIANFLYDPDVSENVRNLPQAVRETYTSYAKLSAALEEGTVTYALVRLKVSDDWSEEEIAAHNSDKLRSPMSYPAAVEAMLRRPHVDYPAAVDVEADEPEIHEATPVVVTGRAASRRHAVSSVRQQELENELRASLAEVLHLKASDIDVDQPFNEVGLDSFLGVEWINAINTKYGTALPNIVVYDYPSVKALASFLEQELPQRAADSPEPDRLGRSPRPLLPASPARAQSNRFRRTRQGRHDPAAGGDPSPADKVAIVGMSGRYPQAPGLREYWDNLAGGKSAIVEIPPHRWDVGRYYDPNPGATDKTCSKWLGLLDDVDCFDPLFFRIAPHDAVHMDPQHRLFLEESYKAFEDAGYSPDALNNTKCGVYLGISTNEYALRLLQGGVTDAPVTSNSFAIAAARIAYYLNLKGPAISVDTACSSSLVAIHLACQALLNGETDMALAGGVNLWLNPESYLAMSQAGMLSPSGQCRAFDDAADGIVVGEGVGALVLKRLKDAQRDDDPIYGVILGSGINQDGRTNGITAPSVHSQTELIREVYSRYGIDPETIGYVETHGTGTKLGDPIELTALATVFKEKTAKKNFCALASVKSNIGHTAAAAGVASVQKVLLSMRHRTLVPTLNVAKENTQFDFGESPFYISSQKKPWDAVSGRLRRAAVSSFGFSGTNAHLVIEEYSPPAGRAVPTAWDTTFIVPLSSRTEEQLQQKARDLLERITSPPNLDLASVAYTLQVGREAMEERLGFVVSSVDQLAERLRAYIDGEKSGGDVYRGRVAARNEDMAIISGDDDMREAIDRWVARRKLAKLLDLWTKGLDLDWHRLYGDVKPQRISLPTYPFAREHYWVDERPAGPDPNRKVQAGGNIRLIEDIIDRIGDDAMETDEAVRLLKVLV